MDECARPSPSWRCGGAPASHGGLARDARSVEESTDGRRRLAKAQRHVLIENPSTLKEFELELMRDGNDNVVGCARSRTSTDGVHTGDSVTVAPR
ncbi:hypothetical protein [Mycobacterium avium]|uniref:ATP-binding protein n=1 Tax=Mycobacterium avium TaxID=1764 RepID=UPI002E78E1FD|nr:hypothetical protein [Mycobacterium avium]